MEELRNVWENYGDANPIPHGGFWIKKIGINEYEYVELSFVDDTFEFIIDSGLVDLTDDWIDWNAVNKTCDINENTCDEWKVRELVWYYGHSNFGSYGEDYTFKYSKNYDKQEEVEKEIEEALKGYGIEI
jgi:hypothetical protein